jgi:hypothetical protein
MGFVDGSEPCPPKTIADEAGKGFPIQNTIPGIRRINTFLVSSQDHSQKKF